MGGDLGVGVQRKAMDAGTAGTGKRWRLGLGAKARADTPHLLARAFAKGDTLLDGGRHGPGELGCVIDQRVISCGHGDVETRFQVSELPQCADDAPADLLDHVGDGGVRRWLAWEKARLAPWSVRIQIDSPAPTGAAPPTACPGTPGSCVLSWPAGAAYAKRSAAPRDLGLD